MRQAIIGFMLSGVLGLTACTTSPAPDTTPGPGTVPVSARPLAPYDTGAVPYAPKQVSLPGCGLSIGLDPRWTRTDEGIAPRVSVVSRMDSAASRKMDPHPFNDISVGPLTTIQVVCRPAQAELGTTALYTASYLTALSQQRTPLAPPEVTPATIAAPGSWNRIVYRSASTGGSRFLVVAFVSVHDGRQRRIIVRMFDPAESNRDQLVRYVEPGTTHVSQAQDDTPAMAATLLRRSGVDRSGALYPVRTRAEDLALAERIAATLH